MRLEHVMRNCNTLRDQERLLTKSARDFCLREALRWGSPAWVHRAAAVTARKLCSTKAVVAEAPGLGPSTFLPVVAALGFVLVFGPTSFPNVVPSGGSCTWAAAGFWQLLLWGTCSRSTLCSMLSDIWLFEQLLPPQALCGEKIFLCITLRTWQ